MNRVGRVLPSFGKPSAEAWFAKAQRKNPGVGDPRPETVAAVDTILELFPDARFVFTHRDPATTMSSLCSLYAYTRALFSDDVDPHALGPGRRDSRAPDRLLRALRPMSPRAAC